MRKIRKWIGICGMAAALAMALPRPAAEAASYRYDAASNTYTLSVKSGANITDKLQEALDTAVGTPKKQAVVVIPKGSYKINLVRIDASYVTVRADGAAISFAGSGTGGQYMLKETADTAGVRISGGTWDGKGKAAIAFQFSGNCATKDFTAEDCAVKNCRQYNVRVSNGKGVTFRNVRFSGANYGMAVQDSKDVHLEGCFASGNTFGYALADLKGKNTMKDCSCSQNKTDGLQAKNTGTVIEVEGGKYEKNGKNGISMTTGAVLHLSGADISGNHANGISPVGSKPTKTVLTAEDCKFNKNGRHGIAADKYVSVTVKDCEANENKANGIFLNHGCSAGTIEDCTANGNKGGSGILIQNKSTVGSIEGCTANRNNLGISVKDAKATVEDCVADKNKKHGFEIATTNAKSKDADKAVSIKNCEACGNKADGMCVTEKKTVVITKTKIKDNGQSGIESKGKLLHVKGAGNVISGNGKYGVYCNGGKMRVEGASLSNNKTAGAAFVNKTSGSCTGAKISGSGIGIMAHSGASLSKVDKNVVTGCTQAGISCTSGDGGSSKISQMKGNKLDNPKAAYEVRASGGSTLPSGVQPYQRPKLSESVKAGKKDVSGTTGLSGKKIKVKVGTAKAKAVKTGQDGSFSVKAARKLKKGTKIQIEYSDPGKNTFVSEYEVR